MMLCEDNKAVYTLCFSQVDKAKKKIVVFPCLLKEIRFSNYTLHLEN